MEENLYRRRDFLGQMVKAGAAGIMVSPLKVLPGKTGPPTVNQVIERIITEVPGGKLNDTVDILKSGSGDALVTGIVTTMFATVPVIREAAALKANFIIAHEPTYYNHADDKTWVRENEVLQLKKALLDRYKIAVWRFHDYWHAVKPDGILYGVLLKTGWLPYNPGTEVYFQIPARPLQEIIGHLKKSLDIPHLRYIGDPASACSRICLLPGAWGGQRQVETLIKYQADLLIVGESNEWETPEYIRDAQAFGKPVSMIVLGHADSEEPGMEWLVQWLKPKIPSVPILHIPSGSPFSWI